MKHFDNLTDGMQYLLRVWAQWGGRLWISFETTDDKLKTLSDKWAEIYGTRLPPHTRHYRKQKGLPLAWACSMPTIGATQKRVFLLTQPAALALPADTPWHRERWRRDNLQVGDLFIVAQQRNAANALVWTWKFQDRQLALIEKYLVSLVKAGDIAELAEQSRRYTQYPMFAGSRAGLRRVFRSCAKLWCAMHKTTWPGQDPDHLPFVGGFRNHPHALLTR